ncbi:hypothetical protein HHK36_020956 [Tetracentron sinense]|uniref:Uncharacterized protein n=1 Tax=Tetracentron sinense TaxID=13715 RepID=A0A834YSN1_TETSI|nr:hypothetical protein HHK36_020956 [Tetracentron sinense]
MKRDQTSECDGCSSEERWLLHSVRHRGIYRRLCTSCVLKFFPVSFCPICYEVYEGSPPSHDRVMCLKCPSISHFDCVGIDVASHFVCPPCVNPSFLFFDVGVSNKRIKGGNRESVLAGSINQESAKVFFAAARLATISMNKAVTTARVEMERRVKEAVLLKKRASEALELCDSLESRDKEKRKGSTGIPGSVPLVEAQKKKSKGNGAAAAAAAVAAQKRNQNHLRGDGMDNTGGVSKSLNNAGSTEKERWAGFQEPTAVPEVPKSGVSVEEKDRFERSPAPGMGLQLLQNPDAVNEKERPINSPHLQNPSSVQGEEENNGLFSVHPVAIQLQNTQNGHRHSNEMDRDLNGFANPKVVPPLTHSDQGGHLACGFSFS